MSRSEQVRKILLPLDQEGRLRMLVFVAEEWWRSGKAEQYLYKRCATCGVKMRKTVGKHNYKPRHCPACETSSKEGVIRKKFRESQRARRKG